MEPRHCPLYTCQLGYSKYPRIRRHLSFSYPLVFGPFLSSRFFHDKTWKRIRDRVHRVDEECRRRLGVLDPDSVYHPARYERQEIFCNLVCASNVLSASDPFFFTLLSFKLCSLLVRYAHPCNETGSVNLCATRHCHSRQEQISIHNSKALLPHQGYQCAGGRTFVRSFDVSDTQLITHMALPLTRVVHRRSLP